MIGVLVIDKPVGITSHDVVNHVRRALKTRRVGHAGSLDPLGAGALVVAVGPATRFLQYLPLEPKTYVCEATFGVETATQDGEGEVVREAPVPLDLERRIAEALPAFLGEIEQLPPMYSAVKKAGRPLYDYARRGETVEREPRTVFVDAFDTLAVEPPKARFRIECSGGTYVRALVHDLGNAIGCGAYLSALSRTLVGKFDLRDAIQLDEVSPRRLIPLREALPPMRVVTLSGMLEAHVREGRSIPVPAGTGDRLVALADAQGEVFAAARVTGQRLQPECVIPREALYGAV
jgi:tRNA pseudouridine55 synthase